MTCLRLGASVALLVLSAASARAQAPRATPAPVAPGTVLHIIAFGAHPDDCELNTSGVAAKWAALGHKFKCVAVTNGDIGHWQSAGGPLALRRRGESQRAAKILGIETEVLDNHDGELMVTLENRRKIARLIREWQADIVISHRPNDYHPDHRYTGVLVMDAAYMVQVPFFGPEVPPLKRNPVFLFSEDRFQKPNPFSGDIVVGIDDVIDKKLAAVNIATGTATSGMSASRTMSTMTSPRTSQKIPSVTMVSGRPATRSTLLSTSSVNTELPYIFLINPAGTMPFRKPGIFAFLL
jgi:LmbE family N-acetylglucosaminyl deacetylase